MDNQCITVEVVETGSISGITFQSELKLLEMSPEKVMETSAGIVLEWSFDDMKEWEIMRMSGYGSSCVTES